MEPIPPLRVSHPRQPARPRASPIPLLMLVATAIWVAAVFLYGCYIVGSYGTAVAMHPSVFQQIWFYPTVPYGMAMVVLVVVRFAGKGR